MNRMHLRAVTARVDEQGEAEVPRSRGRSSARARAAVRGRSRTGGARRRSAHGAWRGRRATACSVAVIGELPQRVRDAVVGRGAEPAARVFDRGNRLRRRAAAVVHEIDRPRRWPRSRAISASRSATGPAIVFSCGRITPSAGSRSSTAPTQASSRHAVGRRASRTRRGRARRRHGSGRRAPSASSRSAAARVPVGAAGLVGKDHRDGVVRVAGEQPRALGGVDHVVGRAQQPRELRAVGARAQRAEGLEAQAAGRGAGRGGHGGRSYPAAGQWQDRPCARVLDGEPGHARDQLRRRPARSRRGRLRRQAGGPAGAGGAGARPGGSGCAWRSSPTTRPVPRRPSPNTCASSGSLPMRPR